MTNRRKYDPACKDQVFATLRREILAARLKVTLDEQLNRKTSPTVERLAKMKLPPIVRSSRHFGEVTAHRKSSLERRDQVFDTLRREILAARLKVTLDEQLNRDTSPTVKRLARMKLPPIVRPYYRVNDVQADAAGRDTSSD